MKNKDSRPAPGTIVPAVAALILAFGLAACQAPAPPPEQPTAEAPPPLAAEVEEAAAIIDQELVAEHVARLAKKGAQRSLPVRSMGCR